MTSSTKKQNLIFCPFCGYVPDRDDPDCVHPVTRPDKDGRQVWRAGCLAIAGGCDAEVLGWSAEEAIANWNKRV